MVILSILEPSSRAAVVFGPLLPAHLTTTTTSTAMPPASLTPFSASTAELTKLRRKYDRMRVELSGLQGGQVTESEDDYLDVLDQGGICNKLMTVPNN